MLRTCVQKFDMTGTVQKKFWTKRSLIHQGFAYFVISEPGLWICLGANWMLVVKCAGLLWQWPGKYSDPSRLRPVSVWDVVCCCGLVAVAAAGWIPVFINRLVTSDLMWKKPEWHASFGFSISEKCCLWFLRRKWHCYGCLRLFVVARWWHVRWGLPGSGWGWWQTRTKAAGSTPIVLRSGVPAYLPLLQAWC